MVRVQLGEACSSLSFRNPQSADAETRRGVVHLLCKSSYIGASAEKCCVCKKKKRTKWCDPLVSHRCCCRAAALHCRGFICCFNRKMLCRVQNEHKTNRQVEHWGGAEVGRKLLSERETASSILFRAPPLEKASKRCGRGCVFVRRHFFQTRSPCCLRRHSRNFCCSLGLWLQLEFLSLVAAPALLAVRNISFHERGHAVRLRRRFPLPQIHLVYVV